MQDADVKYIDPTYLIRVRVCLHHLNKKLMLQQKAT